MIEQPSSELPPPSLIPIAAIVGWLLAAAALAATGIPARLQPPAPQLVLLGVTAALIIAGTRLPLFRGWLRRLDWRTIVGFHASRALAGAAFLVAERSGNLPARWAQPSAYGDIAVATLAMLLIAAVAPRRSGARGAYLAWNVVGLFDILAVVIGAARIAMSDPSAMVALFRLPLAIIPLWLVPLIIASHILLFVRLRQPVSA